MPDVPAVFDGKGPVGITTNPYIVPVQDVINGHWIYPDVIRANKIILVIY